MMDQQDFAKRLKFEQLKMTRLEAMCKWKQKDAKGKKKNPGPADFKKQKVKVGRKLVKKNETSTSIKSRKLNLQKQSVAGEWCLALRATPWGSTLTRLRSS